MSRYRLPSSHPTSPYSPFFDLELASNMLSSNFLSVPVLESRATSSSSSSSSSSMFGTDLQMSDSQTDYSPPHSPKKDASRFIEPFVKSFLEHATHLDRDLATPKQSPRLLDRSDWLGESDDVGYDSEHENLSSDSPTKHLPRLLTRKRVPSSRHLVAGVVLEIGVDIPPQTLVRVSRMQRLQNSDFYSVNCYDHSKRVKFPPRHAVHAL